MKSQGSKGVSFAFLMLALVPFLVSACGTPSSPASCAFVAGDGRDGRDSKLQEIVYPGQNLPGDASAKVVSYVPCNSRNFIINDGTVKNANEQVVGDRKTLISATTSTGVPIRISAHALWTLNQSEQAMRDFYTVCFKYQCASDKDQGGSVNFSTPGWNGMLAENFGPAMDMAARVAAIHVDDSVWKTHDPSQYQGLGDRMSEAFGDAVRANLGFPEDLFCGSGNSRWSDPDNPGKGTFTCTPVRIVVDSVVRGEIRADESTAGGLEINKQRLENAQALYGEDAGSWLGLQDTVEKCKDAKVPCIVNIGGNGGGPAVVMPSTNPAPTPTPAKK